mmetsp:Transcript_29204/g.100815  ORF Transcript_29204/g.100815 Transcript_29204/m.100815 type:complete len:203 (-) Transcript_29204:406-1014(-)
MQSRASRPSTLPKGSPPEGSLLEGSLPEGSPPSPSAAAAAAAWVWSRGPQELTWSRLAFASLATTSKAWTAAGRSSAQSGSCGAAEGPTASTTRRESRELPSAKTTRARSAPRRSTRATRALRTAPRTPGYWSMRWSTKSRKSCVDGSRNEPRKPLPAPLRTLQSQPSSPPRSCAACTLASRSTTSRSRPNLAANCCSAKES